jgi:hypothetical protein
VLGNILDKENEEKRQLTAKELEVILTSHGVTLPIQKAEDGHNALVITRFDTDSIEEMLAENEAKRNAVLEAKGEMRQGAPTPNAKKAVAIDISTLTPEAFEAVGRLNGLFKKFKESAEDMTDLALAINKILSGSGLLGFKLFGLKDKVKASNMVQLLIEHFDLKDSESIVKKIMEIDQEFTEKNIYSV